MNSQQGPLSAPFVATLGGERFSRIAHEALDRAEFPELNAVLADLGVMPGTRGEAIFQPAPHSAIRDAIMAASEPGADGNPHEQQ